MAKVDFKTSDEKKNELKLAAARKGVTVSYIMNHLLDDYLNGNAKIVKKQEIAILLTKVLHESNHLPEGSVKEEIIHELEELICRM